MMLRVPTTTNSTLLLLIGGSSGLKCPHIENFTVAPKKKVRDHPNPPYTARQPTPTSTPTHRAPRWGFQPIHCQRWSIPVPFHVSFAIQSVGSPNGNFFGDQNLPPMNQNEIAP